MKIYLEDGGAQAPRKNQGSRPTTQRSSRSGGFKPTKPGRETYDTQGFGGAGRRSGQSAVVDEDEAPGGIPLGVDPEDEGTWGADAADAQEPDAAEDASVDGDDEDAEEGEPEPAPRRRSRSSDADMTEAEFEAYMASKNKKRGKQPKQAKAAKQPKQSKKDKKGSAITIGKNAGSAGKKAGKAAAAPKAEKKGITISGSGSKKAVKAPKVTEEPEDEFDELFDGNNAPSESIVSQIITLVEVFVGSGLSFFGAMQLGKILITSIMSGG